MTAVRILYLWCDFPTGPTNEDICGTEFQAESDNVAEAREQSARSGWEYKPLFGDLCTDHRDYDPYRKEQTDGNGKDRHDRAVRASKATQPRR